MSDYAYTDDLSRTGTLPARWYVDPAFLALENERIFARAWQPVGRAEMALRPGDYFTCQLVGEPLVITRGKEGQLRGFYNVCRHRAGPVAVGKGNRQSLQGYHIPIAHPGLFREIDYEQYRVETFPRCRPFFSQARKRRASFPLPGLYLPSGGLSQLTSCLEIGSHWGPLAQFA